MLHGTTSLNGRKSTNENTHALIRQYFTKGLSLESITNKYIAEVQDILNNQPRKKLKILTPNEYFTVNLQNHTSCICDLNSISNQ